MKLVAPNGRDIVGTADVVFGTALISEVAAEKLPDGTFDIEFGGETEIDWNSQETRKRRGKRLFVDDEGYFWPEHKLKLIDPDED